MTRILERGLLYGGDSHTSVSTNVIKLRNAIK